MNSPFAWPGGKRNLVRTLLQRIPEHSIYVEVFAGSAKLLFAKEPSRCEVLNDMNGLAIETVQTSYALSSKAESRGKVTEVLITPREQLQAAA